MASAFDPTPRALVIDGQFQFGTYGQAIALINPLDALPPLLRPLYDLRLKEWQAFQMMDEEYFIVGAIYLSKVVDLLQLVVVEKRSGRLQKWERKLPPYHLRIAQGLDGTRSAGESGGFRMTFANNIPSGRLDVDAYNAAGSDLAPMSLAVSGRCGAAEAAHLVICHPFANGKALYSHKCIMPAGGELQIDGQQHQLAADRGVLILDDHKGFYPMPMAYNWVTAAQRGSDGAVVGFNLTQNQIRDPDRYNENAVWLGATIERLPAVRFERPRGVYGTWEIKDREGRVNVRFAPTVPNEVHVGPAHALAEYYGPFGRFEGTIARASGETIDVGGMFGMGEQKRIRM